MAGRLGTVDDRINMLHRVWLVRGVPQRSFTQIPGNHQPNSIQRTDNFKTPDILLRRPNAPSNLRPQKKPDEGMKYLLGAYQISSSLDHSQSTLMANSIGVSAWNTIEPK